MLTKETKRNAGLWVSVLYFAEGFPYTIVNIMSIIFLKGLGVGNDFIGLTTSLLSLPWVFKGLWGPIVDVYSTKRKWILICEIFCTILFAGLALGVLFPNPITICLIILSLIAFVSATHDIAIDGFYLINLNPDLQALFVGVRNTAYRGAVIVGSGGLVFLAGTIADKYLINENGTKTYQNIPLSLLGLNLEVQPLQLGWAIAFFLGAIIFLGIYLFQRWYLPYPQTTVEESVASGERREKINFIESFKTYFTQDHIGWIVAFVLLFRLGDSLTIKMSAPFLMDKIEKGGLAISTSEMGILSGTFGVIALLVGGLIGGYLIAKQGLKRWIWPMAIMQNTTNIFYWLLALSQPGLQWAYVVNSIEQFTYGLGVAAYTVFLMRTVRPEYKASHYAITTGFMAAGVLIPGLFSGFIQEKMGYSNYFFMSFFATIPGMLTIFFLPLDTEKKQLSSNEE
jgi:PAT family beta-lactamase induction signal transducer AmpG